MKKVNLSEKLSGLLKKFSSEPTTENLNSYLKLNRERKYGPVSIWTKIFHTQRKYKVAYYCRFGGEIVGWNWKFAYSEEDAIHQVREDIGEPDHRDGDPEWMKEAFPGKDGFLYDIVPPATKFQSDGYEVGESI